MCSKMGNINYQETRMCQRVDLLNTKTSEKKITKEPRNVAAEDRAIIMKPACFYDTAKTYLGQAPTVTSLHYSASKTQNTQSMWKIEIEENIFA